LIVLYYIVYMDINKNVILMLAARETFKKQGIDFASMELALALAFLDKKEVLAEYHEWKEKELLPLLRESEIKILSYMERNNIG
jgi:hypothetical protein